MVAVAEGRRPTSRLAGSVQAAVGIVAMLELILGILMLQAAAWFAGHPGATERHIHEAFRVSGRWMFGLVLALSAAYATAGILWLVWQYRATRQVWKRGVPGLKVRPGWAVGWWFIPYANYVMPALAMQELRRAATGDVGSAEAKRGGAIVWIWLALRVSGVAAAIVIGVSAFQRVGLTVSPQTHEVPIAEVVQLLKLLALGVGIQMLMDAAAAVTAALLVGQVHARLRDDLPRWIPPRSDLAMVPARLGLPLASRPSVSSLTTRRPASLVRGVLYAQACVLLLTVAAYLQHAAVYRRIDAGAYVPPDRVVAANDFVGATAGLWALVFMVSVVLWCVWEVRAHQVGRALVPEEAPTPWSVAFWFVPFANLVVPYRSIRGLWRVSGGKARVSRTWWVIPIWWATWLGWWVLVLLGGDAAPNIDAVIRQDLFSVAGLLVASASALLAAEIVRSITRRQAWALADLHRPSMPV